MKKAFLQHTQCSYERELSEYAEYVVNSNLKVVERLCLEAGYVYTILRNNPWTIFRNDSENHHESKSIRNLQMKELSGWALFRATVFFLVNEYESLQNHTAMSFCENSFRNSNNWLLTFTGEQYFASYTSSIRNTPAKNISRIGRSLLNTVDTGKSLPIFSPDNYFQVNPTKIILLNHVLFPLERIIYHNSKISTPS